MKTPIKTPEEIRSLMSIIESFIDSDAPMGVSVLKMIWNDLSDIVTKYEEYHAQFEG